MTKLSQKEANNTGQNELSEELLQSKLWPKWSHFLNHEDMEILNSIIDFRVLFLEKDVGSLNSNKKYASNRLRFLRIEKLPLYMLPLHYKLGL